MCSRYGCIVGRKSALRSCKCPPLCHLRFLPRSVVRPLNASVDSWIPALGQPFRPALAAGTSPESACQQSVSVIHIWADIHFLVTDILGSLDMLVVKYCQS